MQGLKLFRDFEPDRVKRLRDACVGIARAFKATTKRSKNREERYYANAVAATYFRRAAANSILMDEFPVAREWFAEAARCYSALDMQYGVLMEAICGFPVGDWSWKEAGESPQGVYALIASVERQIGDFDGLRKVRHKLEEFRGQRLGVFALPVDLYLDLFDAIHLAIVQPDTGLRGLRQSLLPFVQTYSLALQRARRDTFHWQRLAMVFHPAEPDIVGLLSAATKALQRANITHVDLLEDLPISLDAAAVLHYCLENTTRGPNNHMEGDQE